MKLTFKVVLLLAVLASAVWVNSQDASLQTPISSTPLEIRLRTIEIVLRTIQSGNPVLTGGNLTVLGNQTMSKYPADGSIVCFGAGSKIGYCTAVSGTKCTTCTIP